MSLLWMYVFVIAGGALQTCGAAMNGQLKNALRNPWLASTVSFAVIIAFFGCLFLVLPKPLPGMRDLNQMPQLLCSAARARPHDGSLPGLPMTFRYQPGGILPLRLAPESG